MEKIINEFKIIETDDGFRIELKGDKEAIRKMLQGCGPHGFFGGGFPFGHDRGFHFDFDPFAFWCGFGNWWDKYWETEKEEKKPHK